MTTRPRPKLQIPGGPGEISPAWLTAALRETGAIRDSAVVSFDTETIGEGVGLIGQLARLTLQYGRPGSGPRSLVAKFPAATPENREIGDLFRFYEREVRFYQEIASRVELRTPRCYYSAMDIEAGDYVLLLEDMAPARVGDQIASCSREEAELAVSELAKFHAAWWQSPHLEELSWMPYVNDPIQKSAEESYQRSWDPFLEKFGDRVPPPALRAAEALATNIINILDRFVEPPRTIIHGDYRLDNLFFATPEGGDPLAVIDWQIASRGRGVFDVAYFLCTNVNPRERKAWEMDLLRRYHRLLSAGGARDYDFDRCLYDYRVSALFCLVYCVIAGGTLDLSNERGVALACAMTDRTVAAVQDLDAAAVLPLRA